MVWNAGFVLAIMTFVVADVPDQAEPSTPALAASPEGSVSPQASAKNSEKTLLDVPPATDDFEKRLLLLGLLLLLVGAALGALGAQLLPGWRVAKRWTLPGCFEDGAMTTPESASSPRPDDTSTASVEPAAPRPHADQVVADTHPQPKQASPTPTVLSPVAASVEPAAAAPAPTAPPIQPPQASPATPAEPTQLPAVVAAPHGPSTVDVLRETRASHSHQSWGSFNRHALPRLLFYGGNKFCQFSTDKLHAADEWFVIGDIHGDFYALHTIVSHIRKACPQFGIIFLGDLIDRGPHPIECLWYLLKVAADHPERVLWLAGNHDVGARYDEATGEFRSTVEPAEFVSDLNIVDSFTPLRRTFGREYIELAEGLPRAALMPDGLLLTHGGFPHTDLQAELGSMALDSERRKWLEKEEVIRDFTHLRITKYPLRKPNRLSISCSYGYQDFDAFKRAMTGYGIKRLVTGHEHAAAGFNNHPEWAKNGHEALTLTGFGFADAYDRPESYAVNYRRTLVAGRHRPDQIPEVVPINVDESDLNAFFEAEIRTLPRFSSK